MRLPELTPAREAAIVRIRNALPTHPVATNIRS
jgi:hypothetical protein